MEYRAGTCNIDDVERKKRLVAGAAGFLNSAILTAVIVLIPRLFVLYTAILFLNFMGFLGVIQYRYRFCAGLALRKKFHNGESEKEVGNPGQVAEDRRTAVKIIVQSAMASALLTAGTCLVLANI